MRIIAGKYKSRRIQSSVSSNNCRQTVKSNFRPTTDRARETLFNILASKIDFEGMKCLDLYAGTGSFGFESLSRGASACVFVDNSSKSGNLILQTADELRCREQTKFLNRDVMSFLKTNSEEFDIIFADPPYNHEDYYQLANEMLNHTSVASVIEYRLSQNLDKLSNEGFEVISRNVGVTNFKIYIVN